MEHEETKRTAAPRKARRRCGRTKRIVETSFVNAPWSARGVGWYGRRTRRMGTVSTGFVGEGIALIVGLDRSSEPLSRPFDAARGRAMRTKRLRLRISSSWVVAITLPPICNVVRARRVRTCGFVQTVRTRPQPRIRVLVASGILVHHESGTFAPYPPSILCRLRVQLHRCT